MEQKVTPQNIRGLGNVCDNFSENDFIKINADTTLQPNVNVNNTSLRCFRVQMKGRDLTIITSGSNSLKYGVASTFGVTVKTADNNTPVSGLIVGLYLNDNLVASSSRTTSTGYTTITYTPNTFGNVTLEFKVLPQSNYAMVKTTRNVSISIGTVITVYSPYVPAPSNGQLSGFAVWVTAEDGTIIDTTVSMSNGISLDTQTSSALESLTVLDSIPVGTNITYSYGGEGFYESSTANNTGEGFYESSTTTKKAGIDGSYLTTKPPALPSASGGK